MLTTPHRSPAQPLALALSLALALASCARLAQPAYAGTAAAAPSATSTAPVSADTVALHTAAELGRVAGSLGSATGRTLGSASSFSYIQGRRTSSGQPERHERWTDIAYVQGGHATVLTGGSIRGGKQGENGEERGGSIVGGTEHAIAAGDLLVIPAGVPHQYRLASGDTLTYLTIKVPAPH